MDDSWAVRHQGSPKPHEIGVTLISSVSKMLKDRESVMKVRRRELLAGAAPPQHRSVALAEASLAALQVVPPAPPGASTLRRCSED